MARFLTANPFQSKGTTTLLHCDSKHDPPSDFCVHLRVQFLMPCAPLVRKTFKPTENSRSFASVNRRMGSSTDLPTGPEGRRRILRRCENATSASPLPINANQVMFGVVNSASQHEFAAVRRSTPRRVCYMWGSNLIK